MARSGREVGGLLAVVRRRGRVRAALEQRLDALAVAVLRRRVERGEAAALAGVRVGAVLEEQLDDRAVAAGRCAVQRRDLELGVPRDRVRIRPVLEQQPSRVLLTEVRSEMQRREAVARPCLRELGSPARSASSPRVRPTAAASKTSSAGFASSRIVAIPS